MLQAGSVIRLCQETQEGKWSSSRWITLGSSNEVDSVDLIQNRHI